MSGISVQALNWRQWSELAPAWELIHNRCPEASFFLSREWVDCWLATFGADLNPELLAFVRDGEAVGCCVLVTRTQWVRGIPLRRVYLNCAGEDEADSTCIEYNSLLSLPGCEEDVAKAFGTFLEGRSWDELRLNAMAGHSPVCAVGSLLGSREVFERRAPYVNMRQIRAGAADFDSVLSSNTRHQIRRSQRMYEQAGGPCTFHLARTVQEAEGIFERMAELHQAAWQDRGRPGVFSSAKFTSFHRRLIEAVFKHNRILLAEVRAGTEVIAALYSFIYRGRVYFYQSGLRYTADGRLKPGLVSHWLAIRYCLEQPELTEYDFLAGDSQYKRSLATASRELSWIVVRRRTVPSLVFRVLRSVKRRFNLIAATISRGAGRGKGD